ncbi:GtrA family protein [Streptococcus fryi]
MKTIKHFLNNEIIKYIIAGVLATLVYLVIRLGLYPVLNNATAASIVANISAICFAFITNDRYVFRQDRHGWQERFTKFFIARLATLALDFLLAFFLVDTFPNIIGQFVNGNLNKVNSIVTIISQVLIFVGNYIISKYLVFNKETNH